MRREPPGGAGLSACTGLIPGGAWQCTHGSGELMFLACSKKKTYTCTYYKSTFVARARVHRFTNAVRRRTCPSRKSSCPNSDLKASRASSMVSPAWRSPASASVAAPSCVAGRFWVENARPPAADPVTSALSPLSSDLFCDRRWGTLLPVLALPLPLLLPCCRLEEEDDDDSINDKRRTAVKNAAGLLRWWGVFSVVNAARLPLVRFRMGISVVSTARNRLWTISFLGSSVKQRAVSCEIMPPGVDRGKPLLNTAYISV